MVTPFPDGQQQLVHTYPLRLGGQGGRVFATQQNAITQGLQIFITDRVRAAHPVALVALVVRGSKPVGPLAVAGQQHQAGGIPIQAPRRVQILAQRHRQQVQYGAMFRVIRGTHHSRRLMQHQITVARQLHWLVM